ncbi:hypothetical protein Angca_010260, partial [Angiostrongylus cantonensis]
METLEEELSSSERKQKRINQKLHASARSYSRSCFCSSGNSFTLEDPVNDRRSKRQVLKDDGRNSTWKDGVFYSFNTTDNVLQNVFKMGVKIWTENTCIDFIEDENAKDKVVLVKRDGCFSHIGRIGGDQLLALNGMATEGAAVHEIGHTLGFFHTMSRFDRDSYIKILKENISPQHIKRFGRISRNIIDVFGLNYDYGSIMHYGELSGSINNQPTMIALDPNYQKTMGSDLISFSDIFMINEHYGCNAKCNKSTSAKCDNEGFPHPRNCSICICPSGYGGTLCDRRPPGCGADLVAKSSTQIVHYTLGNDTRARYQFEFCNYMITAPVGKKIEVEVLSMSPGYEVEGCLVGGVEIKAQKDQKLTGYRFCSMNGTVTYIVSNSSRLPVILFNRFSMMQASFSFRYI